MGSVTEWLRQHTVTELAPPAVVERGRAYASAGRCVQLDLGPDGVLNARVEGSNGAQYKVVAIGGARLVTRCSCPIGGSSPCKHVICALLTLSAQLAPAPAPASSARPGPAPPTGGAPLARNTPRVEVYAWAKARHVTHWLSISVAAVPQFLPTLREDPVDFLRRRMLPVVDFFGADSRWSHIPARFVDDLVAFLEARAARATAWHAEADARTWPFLQSNGFK